MNCEIKGLILKKMPFKENDLILTVLTAEQGKMNILARGAKRKKTQNKICYELFSYTSFDVYMGRGTLPVADSAEAVEPFYPLRQDIEALSLAQYIADVASFACSEKGSSEILRLVLNSLSLLSSNKYNKTIIKTVFELRFALYEGFAPRGDTCPLCGGDEANIWSFSRGILCNECASGEGFHLSKSEVSAIRHILNSSGTKTYSFTMEKTELDNLSNLTEKYIEYHLEKHFSSLDYYKQFRDMEI